MHPGAPMPVRSIKNWERIIPNASIRFPGTPGISKRGTLKLVSGLPSKLAKGALTDKEKLRLSGKRGSSSPTGPKP